MLFYTSLSIQILFFFYSNLALQLLTNFPTFPTSPNLPTVSSNRQILPAIWFSHITFSHNFRGFSYGRVPGVSPFNVPLAILDSSVHSISGIKDAILF